MNAHSGTNEQNIDFILMIQSTPDIRSSILENLQVIDQSDIYSKTTKRIFL